MSDTMRYEEARKVLLAREQYALELGTGDVEDKPPRASSLATTLSEHITALRGSPQFIDTWVDAARTARLCEELSALIRIRMAWSGPREGDDFLAPLSSFGNLPHTSPSSSE